MNPRGCCFLLALAGFTFLACALAFPVSEDSCVEMALENSPSLKDYTLLPSPQVTLVNREISWKKEVGVTIWIFNLATGETVGTVEHFDRGGTRQEFSLGMYEQGLCLVVYNQVELTAVSKPLIILIPRNGS